MPDDLETPIDNEHAEDSPVIRDLRQKANRTDVAEAKATELQRELVVHKAGLTDLSDKQLKALTLAHEGDWEPEALKATANELFPGAMTAGEQTEPRIPDAELQAHQRVAAAASGQSAPPPPDLTAQIEAAQNPEEIKAILRNAGQLAE